MEDIRNGDSPQPGNPRVRFSKIELVDVVGVKHRWRAQQDYPVFVNRAIAEFAGRERFTLFAFDVA